MGLLDRLFGKRSAAKKLSLDSEEAWNLWQKHIQFYNERASIASGLQLSNTKGIINKKNIITDTAKIDDILRRLQENVSEDIVTIKAEEHDEEAVYNDLQKCLHFEDVELFNFVNRLLTEKNKEQGLVKLFKHLYRVLCLEMHAIHALRNRFAAGKVVVADDVHDVYSLVCLEGKLLEPFKLYGPHHEEVSRISKLIFAGEIVKKKIKKTEDDFVESMESMIAEMGGDEDKGLRALGMGIYGDILKRLGAPFRDYDEFAPKIGELERLATDSGLIEKLVRKKRPKYSDEKVKLVVKAFIEAYSRGHFEDMNEELYG
jgi:hypothetical protein